MSGTVSKAPRASEADLQRAVYDLLDCYTPRGLVWRRVNSGMAQVGRHWVRLAPLGTPDICGHMPDGRALYIELKAPDAKPTNAKDKIRWEAQREFREQAASCGCVAFQARTVNEVASRMAREMGG